MLTVKIAPMKPFSDKVAKIIARRLRKIMKETAKKMLAPYPVPWYLVQKTAFERTQTVENKRKYSPFI